MLRMMISPRLALSCALVLCTSACDLLPMGKESSPAHVVAFTYSGYRTGTFRAQGVPRDDSPRGRPYAVAYSRPEHTAIQVYAFTGTAASRGDLLVMFIPDTEGTYRLGCGTSHGCAMISTSFDLDTGGYEQPGYDDALTADGVLTVTKVTRTRVSGTFSGSSVVSSRPGGARVGDLVVTAGEFDVERRPVPGSYPALMPGNRARP